MQYTAPLAAFKLIKGISTSKSALNCTFDKKKIFPASPIDLYPLGYNNTIFQYICTRKGIIMNLAQFIKEQRSMVKLTQQELAEKAGVGLRFVRELE